MKDILKHFPEKLLKNQKVNLMLDFDGTLSPIVAYPQQAALPAETKETLSNMAASDRVSISVISGRDLKNLKSRINLAGIDYFGNYGLEYDDSGGIANPPEANKFIDSVSKFLAEIRPKLSGFKGTVLEDKKYTLSIHYRNMAKQFLPQLKKEISNTLAAHPNLRLAEGKKVFEIFTKDFRPKEKIVEHLIDANKNHLPIYIGDDTSDEEAFKVVRKEGLSVRVGAEAGSAAQYFLNNQSKVEKLLKMLEKTMI